MNQMSTKRRAQVIAALVEGNSIRSTVRMTGAAKATVTKLLCDLGAACSDHMDEVMRDLPCQRLQCDEFWSFCWAKEKHLAREKQGIFGYGDVWTWTAIDAQTKLVPCWMVGERNLADATAFISDLAGRLANRVQLTTHGHKPYLTTIDRTFGVEIDYAVLKKLYGNDGGEEKRYSPAKCVGIEVKEIVGTPDPAHISTSYAERQNLTMRIGMRRFIRLTNAFSRKVENLAHAVALHFLHYNFARVHMTIKMTPAMASGLTDHVWSLAEIISLLDARHVASKKRGPYKPRQLKIAPYIPGSAASAALDDEANWPRLPRAAS